MAPRYGAPDPDAGRVPPTAAVGSPRGARVAAGRDLNDALVVAPASFGHEATAFVEAAQAELGEVAHVRGAIVDGRRELDRALAGLERGSLVLGSLSSDLAIEVAAACASRGLVHVEAGALTDRVLGTGTLRLTGGVTDTARLAIALAGAARPLAFVAERSLFAEAVGVAIRPLVDTGALVELAIDALRLAMEEVAESPDQIG